MSPDMCPYIWLGDICEPSLNVPKTTQSPSIRTPLSDDFTPLIDLCRSLERILGCNYLQGLGLVAGLVIGLGYQDIIKEFTFCPSVIVTGNLGRGKTTTLSAVMSLTGCDQVG